MDLEKLQNEKLEAYSRENEKDDEDYPDDNTDSSFEGDPEEAREHRKRALKNKFYYVGKIVLDAPEFTGGIDYRK